MEIALWGVGSDIAVPEYAGRDQNLKKARRPVATAKDKGMLLLQSL